jgi:hypothetical protein
MPAIDGQSARRQKARHAVRGPDGPGDTVELKWIDDPKPTGGGASRQHRPHDRATPSRVIDRAALSDAAAAKVASRRGPP